MSEQSKTAPSQPEPHGYSIYDWFRELHDGQQRLEQRLEALEYRPVVTVENTSGEGYRRLEQDNAAQASIIQGQTDLLQRARFFVEWFASFEDSGRVQPTLSRERIEEAKQWLAECRAALGDVPAIQS